MRMWLPHNCRDRHVRAGAAASAAEPAPAYQHLKSLEKIVGDWRTVYEIDGQETEGELHCNGAAGQVLPDMDRRDPGERRRQAAVTWLRCNRLGPGRETSPRNVGDVRWDPGHCLFERAGRQALDRPQRRHGRRHQVHNAACGSLRGGPNQFHRKRIGSGRRKGPPDVQTGILPADRKAQAAEAADGWLACQSSSHRLAIEGTPGDRREEKRQSELFPDRYHQSPHITRGTIMRRIAARRVWRSFSARSPSRPPISNCRPSSSKTAATTSATGRRTSKLQEPCIGAHGKSSGRPTGPASSAIGRPTPRRAQPAEPASKAGTLSRRRSWSLTSVPAVPPRSNGTRSRRTKSARVRWRGSTARVSPSRRPPAQSRRARISSSGRSPEMGKRWSTGSTG